MLQSSRSIGSQFSKETWIIFVKVLLGVSDYVLAYQPIKGKENDNDTLGNILCGDLITVLLEVWLRSHIKDIELWEYLTVRTH